MSTGVDELHKVIVGKCPALKGCAVLDQMPEETRLQAMVALTNDGDLGNKILGRIIFS